MDVIVKPKGFISRIPVRAIKPPNRLPVSNVATTQTNIPQENFKHNTFLDRNISTEAQVKQKKAPTTSREVLHHIKPVGGNVKTKKTISKTCSKETAVAEKNLNGRRFTNATSRNEVGRTASIQSNIANKRLANAASQSENKKFPSKPANNSSTNFNKITNKKLSVRESMVANKRFTDVVSQNNYKSSTSVESSNINRRFTNVTNKNLKKRPAITEKNTVNRRFTDICKMPSKLGIKNKSKKNPDTQLEIKQPNEKEICEESGNINETPNKTTVKATNNELKTDDNLFDSDNLFSKENQASKDENNLNHFTQPDIEFVADERYRNQILSGKELTPNLKSFKKVTQSSIFERASLYKKIEQLEAQGKRVSLMKMKSLRPASVLSPSQYARASLYKKIGELEAEGRRMSMLKMSGLLPVSASSPSQFGIQDPFKTVFKAIENVDLGAEDRRMSAMKRNPVHFGSPHLQRGSVYHPTEDPFKTVLKRLEALEMKKKAKSTKKVTFNLESSEAAPKVVKLDENLKNKNNETPRPMHVSGEKEVDDQRPIPKSAQEKSASKCLPSANSFSSTDKTERNLTESHFNAMLLRICGQSSARTFQNKENPQLSHHTCPGKQRESKALCNDKLTRTETSETFSASENEGLSCNLPRNKMEKRHNTIHSAISQSVGPCLKTYNRLTSAEIRDDSYSSRPPSTILEPSERRNTHSAISQSVGPCLKTYNRLTSTEIRNSLYSSRPPAVMDPGERRNTLSRLCTPKPVSFFPRLNAGDISPEFLGRRTSHIVAHAPISTPMVMRQLAESFDDTLDPLPEDQMSPVCQRLNFDDVEKEAANDPVEDADDSNEIRKFPIQSILTSHKILVQLADEECDIILANAAFPVICERNLQNPVAQILTHGDDMHFLPLEYYTGQWCSALKNSII